MQKEKCWESTQLISLEAGCMAQGLEPSLEASVSGDAKRLKCPGIGTKCTWPYALSKSAGERGTTSHVSSYAATTCKPANSNVPPHHPFG